MKINNIELHWLGHASFLIKWENKRIFIDPYDLSKQILKKADIVFLTHSHYDHCSLKDLEELNPKTIVIPSDCMSKVRRINTKMFIVQPEKEYKLEDIKIITTPAYNETKEFHPKINEWVGYLLVLNDTKIYHAGDTDLLHEMANLEKYKIDIALLPVGGTYTMDSKDASYAARLIKPKIAIPMHYGKIVGSEKDALDFKKELENTNIKVEILEKE